ncbi:MAG: type II toxin-antitoxin system death-on-curing family toxin [Armatimonadetes bacterium]|jgi:death-on-curing protein|nr:type II toxin-antitoxin system death-on-curing family toxin [Armatimonadota bacterium]
MRSYPSMLASGTFWSGFPGSGPPRLLSVKQVIAIHDSQVSRYGGLQGIRDRGLLESAVSAAASGSAEGYFHSFPCGMAAAYAYHISQDQPFLDGNKRTALAAALAFLHVKGFEFPVAAGPLLEQLLIGAAGGSATKQDIEGLLRRHVYPIGSSRPGGPQ